MKNKERSFTLIELLVVIAIIGILAGIVLVALGAVRSSAKDARIMSEMHQIRNQAELTFIGDNDYDDIHCGVTGDIKVLCDDVTAQGGTKPSDGSAGIQVILPNWFDPSVVNDKYCAKVKLNSGKYWCVDSEGRSAKYDSNPLCKGCSAPCTTYEVTCE